jgi:hypothetical protein
MLYLLFAGKFALKIAQMCKQLILYSTSHCHLCERAQALLVNFSEIITLEVIDIAEDEALLARYDVRIPVLLRQDTGAELNWPFSASDVLLFLK